MQEPCQALCTCPALGVLACSQRWAGLKEMFVLTLLSFSSRQAILESEPFSITLKDIRNAKKLGNDFATALGCDDIDCLYNKVCNTASYA